MDYLLNLESALEQQTKSGLQLSASLQALLSHASNQVEQYPSLLIRRAASTLATLNTISEECEEILKILSPNSLLDKEFQTSPAFTSQPKLPSSVFLREPPMESYGKTLLPLVTSSSGLPTSNTGVSTSPQSPSLWRKRTGPVSERGHGNTSTKSVELATSPTTVEPIAKPLTKSAPKKSTTRSKPASPSSTGSSSKKTQTT